jgi:hypothetical protein
MATETDAATRHGENLRRIYNEQGAIERRVLEARARWDDMNEGERLAVTDEMRFLKRRVLELLDEYNAEMLGYTVKDEKIKLEADILG